MKSLFAQFSVKKNSATLSSFNQVALERNDLFKIRGGGDDGRMDDDILILTEEEG